MSGNHLVSRRAVVAGAVGLASVGVGGCSATYATRYKLTIEMDVDGDIKKASVVGEHRALRDLFGNAVAGTTGEALYLDLGPEKRPLVALLYKPQFVKPIIKNNVCSWGSAGIGYQCLAHLYGIQYPDWQKIGIWQRLVGHDSLMRMRGARDFDPMWLPTLVTFADLNDPASVIQVDPANPGTALQSNASWHRVTLEITDEPITRGIIENKLPWLKTQGGRLLKTRKDYDNIATVISQTDFREGR